MDPTASFDNFSTDTEFLDRRQPRSYVAPPAYERRQFGNNYDNLTPDARELAQAIDSYKLRNHRRFITYDEMLFVVKSLGYNKLEAPVQP